MEAYKQEFIEFMPAWFPDFLKCQKSQCFQGIADFCQKDLMYRDLSQIGVISHRNGVVNGVVDCSWFGDGDIKYYIEMV